MFGGFLVRWLFNAVAIYITTLIVPGLRVPSTAGVIVAALILGLVNATIRWFFLVITLPFTILTLGLFTLVINAVMLYIVAALVPSSLQIESFSAAFWGALLIAIISTGLSHLAGR